MKQNILLYPGHGVVEKSKVRTAEFAAVEFPLQCDHEEPPHFPVSAGNSTRFQRRLGKKKEKKKRN